VQDSIKPLLLRNTSLCSIKKMNPAVGMATLSQYRREFLVEASTPTVFECVTKLFISLIVILGDFITV
jgi:hypothetical protein